MTDLDHVTVSTCVAVDALTAFEVFTEEIDRWWRRGPTFRFTAGHEGTLRCEPGVGGRLIESYPDAEPWEVGRVRVWEPGERLVFSFRFRGLGPGDSTEVEVRFEPEGDRTRVTVWHRGFASLAADDPARHGLDDSAFGSVMGVWWSDLLTAVGAHLRGPRHGSAG